jgi:uncharacterized protein YchJ
MVQAIEEVDPEFAELILGVLEHNKSAYPKVAVENNKVYHVFGGTWCEAEATKDPIPGRNDPCLCGSGKKFKKCCGEL